MIDPVELLRSCLAIASPSGAEAGVAGFLVSRMAEFADDAFVDGSGSAVAVVGSGPLRVTFLGHIDTVPGEIPVRVEGELLYGRGAVDAKGPLCAAVAAASRLPAAARSALTLTLIGATEEELPSSKGARHALLNQRPPDLLIVGEPSGWDAVTLGYKGRLVLLVEASKPNHHSAGSESSAAEDGVAAWLSARDWARSWGDGRDGLFDRVQATLQAIHSESDGLMQRCRATIGFRLPPGLPPKEARASLRATLPAGPEYDFRGAEAAYRGPRDTRLTRAFRRAIRELGGTPRFKLKTGTSDMNVVAPHWRVPMLAYGAGESGLDHTPNEHVRLDDLQRATEVLLSVFTDLAQRPESS